jgi:hypothetical protein
MTLTSRHLHVVWMLPVDMEAYEEYQDIKSKFCVTY